MTETNFDQMVEPMIARLKQTRQEVCRCGDLRTALINAPNARGKTYCDDYDIVSDRLSKKIDDMIDCLKMIQGVSQWLNERRE